MFSLWLDFYFIIVIDSFFVYYPTERLGRENESKTLTNDLILVTKAFYFETNI